MELYFLLVWLFWHTPNVNHCVAKSCGSFDYNNPPIRVKG